MDLPHRISTLLYAFSGRDEVLLLERVRPPNVGRWSPPGGKLRAALGESPYACACREAREEMGIALEPGDLHLAGVVSERGYEGQAHWLMFLFEIKPRLSVAPPPIPEGRFAFYSRADIDRLDLPDTDRDMIWPLFWRHRGGFFAAHCRVDREGAYSWIIEETWRRPPRGSRRASGSDPGEGTGATSAADGAQPPQPSDAAHMAEALRQARRALVAREVPVGAVVVRDGVVIARAHNQVELLHDATAHAEMLALTQAQAAVGDWRLSDCTMYVTKEPCAMCAGAMVQARVGRLVYGVPDPRAGAAGGAMNLLDFAGFNHRCPITSGVGAVEARELLQGFFAERRAPSGGV